MAAGLRVWNESGVLIFDTNDYTCRTLGYTDIGNGTGTIVDDRFTTGIPWVFPVMSASVNQSADASTGLRDMSFWATGPVCSVSGNTLTWTRDVSKNPGAWTTPACRLYYGVN
jgi:hypothetical protein